MCLQKEIPARSRLGLLRRLLTDVRGSQLFEAALVLPILLMLLIGMVWLGRAFSVYQALGRAAREGARVALAPTCATCGDAFASDAEVKGVVDAALSAASLDTTNPDLQVQVSRNQLLDPSDPARYQVSGVAVTVTYPVQMNVPFTPLNATTIHISSTVSMHQEF